MRYSQTTVNEENAIFADCCPGSTFEAAADIATAIIADYPLASYLRISHIAAMHTRASNLIDALGGTTAVARMTEAPVSTVHSWRKNGIPPSRIAHMRLAVQAAALEVDFDVLAAGAEPQPAQQAAA